MIVSVGPALVIGCRGPGRKLSVLTVSEGLAPAAGSREPTLAAAFYWKGPVKSGPPLQIDVVEDHVCHQIFSEGPVWTAFVGPVPAGG